jgi:hypothetical protein
MKKELSVNEPEKHLTEAEKQIRRLEELRLEKEHSSKEASNRSLQPSKTMAERTAERLHALRREAEKPSGGHGRIKIIGKQKSSKLTFNQIRILEKLLEKDKRIRGSVVTRIALNRFLGLDNTGEENEMEDKIHEYLRQMNNRP